LVKTKAYAPPSFPKHPELRKLVSKAEKLPVHGRAMEIIKANIRPILYDICSGLSAEDIAFKYGIGERSLWRFLVNKLGVTKSQIEALCREEKSFREMEKRERLQLKVLRKKIVPTDYETLASQLPFWKDIEYRLSSGTKAHYLRIWLELVQFANKHPLDITIDDIINYIKTKQIEWKEKLKKDITNEHVKRLFSSYVIVPLRVFCQYMGIKLTPALKTIEYQSPYRSVRITVDQRYRILEYIMENSSDPEYDKALLFLYYYQGHRAEEVTDIKYEVRERYIITYTKGKKGIIYQKLLPMYVYPEVEIVLDNPPSSYRIDKFRKTLYKAYEVALRKGTVTYYYAIELPRPLHVWRHTACNDLIDYTGYNISVIMEILGWKNPKMIIQVYGEATPDMIARTMGWIIAPRNPFDYLYNEITVINGVGTREGRNWLDLAYHNDYVSEEYYNGVKRNQERLIREFLRRREEY